MEIAILRPCLLASICPYCHEGKNSKGKASEQGKVGVRGRNRGEQELGRETCSSARSLVPPALGWWSGWWRQITKLRPEAPVFRLSDSSVEP